MMNYSGHISNIHLPYEFVLNYEVDVEKNIIIIHYLDLVNFEVISKEPYSKELEEQLLKKMKDQIKELKDLENNLNSKINNNKPFIKYICSLLYFLSFSLSSYTLSKILFLITSLLCGAQAVNMSLENEACKKLIEDYKKNKLFIDNEDTINEFLDSLNEETVMKMDYSMNVNDIHNMSYADVEILVEKAKEYKEEVKVLSLSR